MRQSNKTKNNDQLKVNSKRLFFIQLNHLIARKILYHAANIQAN